MKHDKNPFPFEMPVERLLTEAEKLVLESQEIEMKHIKCRACSNTGWTTDGRDFCSLKCYCMENGLRFDSVNLVKKAVFLDQAACQGDRVVYNNCVMDVIATDCTKERIKRGYHLKYNYVLKFESKLLYLNDLDTPLRKIKISFENKDEANYYEEDEF